MSSDGTRLQRLLAANFAFLTDRPGVPGVVALLMVALCLIRAGLFPGTGGDDGEQLIFSQFFDLGYQVRNPPLYTWMVMAVGKVTGANLWAVNIVKFTLLGLAYVFLWRAARRVLDRPALAALAALSPVLFYYVAWETVTGFSHTVLAAALYAATFWLLLRIVQDVDRPDRQGAGRLADYLWLGLAIGLGAQAKYAYWLFLLSMLAAMMVDRHLRPAVLDRRLLATLAVAAVVALPHYAWLVGRLSVLTGQSGGAAADFSARGLWHAAKAAVGFLSPFWLIVLALFPAAFRRAAPEPMAGPDLSRLLARQMLIVLAATAVGTLLFPHFRVRTHYMMVLILFPLWMMGRIEATAPAEGRLRAYAAVLSLFLLAGPVGMIGKFLFQPLFCERCQHHVPYAALADEFRRAGFTGGTVVAYWHPDPLPGNLRAALPEARVISTKHADVIPPLGPDAAGQCLVVWSADARRDNKPAAIGGANRLVDAGLDPDTPHHLATAPLPMGWGKTAILGYVLTPGRGDCR